MKHVLYAFPGLCTDSRMFALQLCLDYDIRFIEWIPPQKGETMHTYAGRLSKHIDSSQPFSLIGVSMGGMMCMELAKHVKAEKVVLVSSAKTRSELPTHLKALKVLKLNHLIPTALLKQLVTFYSGTVGDLKGDFRAIFKHMIQVTEPKFLHWVINAIIHWDNEEVPDNVVHIHGDKDKVLQYRYVKPDITIKGGTHYMVGTRADEINALLKEILP